MPDPQSRSHSLSHPGQTPTSASSQQRQPRPASYALKSGRGQPPTPYATGHGPASLSGLSKLRGEELAKLVLAPKASSTHNITELGASGPGTGHVRAKGLQHWGWLATLRAPDAAPPPPQTPAQGHLQGPTLRTGRVRPSDTGQPRTRWTRTPGSKPPAAQPRLVPRGLPDMPQEFTHSPQPDSDHGPGPICQETGQTTQLLKTPCRGEKQKGESERERGRKRFKAAERDGRHQQCTDFTGLRSEQILFF